jgi:hypothetical protein
MRDFRDGEWGGSQAGRNLHPSIMGGQAHECWAELHTAGNARAEGEGWGAMRSCDLSWRGG